MPHTAPRETIFIHMTQNYQNELSQILAHVCQPHGLKFSTAAFHFLVSLLCMKCMLPTIVSNKTLLLCIIRVLKEHTSFLMTTLKGSRPLLIKFSDILALCCSHINVRNILLWATFNRLRVSILYEDHNEAQ